MRGAAQGEGLGNQFLANIRDCDAIALVARCFEDGDVTHVEGRVDPLADLDIIETELMIADLESLEKRVSGLEKRAKQGEKESVQALALVKLALAELSAGRPARMAKIAEDDAKAWRMLQLLTTKPALYVCNVDEASAGTGNALSAKVAERAAKDGAKSVVISAKIESEIALLDPDERAEYLETLDLHEPGLDRLIREAYALLGLRTYFTAGPKEARAWTIPVGATGPPGRRRDPHRLRKGLHPRRDHRLFRLRRPERRGWRARCRQAAQRRQGLCRQGRRRDEFPVQRLRDSERRPHGAFKDRPLQCRLNHT